MIAKALRECVAKTGLQIQYIAPGSPWENGYCGSFNGELRVECLRQEIFYSLKEAKIVIGLWQNTYNRDRPHSSLGYRPRLSPSRIWPSGYPWQRPCSSLAISPVQNTGQVNLERAIHGYIDRTNTEPNPFVWTKFADDILASVQRFCQRTSNSYH